MRKKCYQVYVRFSESQGFIPVTIVFGKKEAKEFAENYCREFGIEYKVKKVKSSH